MLNFLKKENYLYSISAGSIINLDLVPDEVFSKRILGDGFAVIPSGGEFFSPATGIINDVSDTLHAYCITTPDGLEILVHIGIDTVSLKGKGFTQKVKKGQKVLAGDLLLTADLKVIEEAGLSTISMVIITNKDKIASSKVLETPEAKPGDKAFLYKF